MWQVGFILFFLSFEQAFAKNPSRSPHEVGTSVREYKEDNLRKRPKADTDYSVSASGSEQKESEQLLNQLLEEISHFNSGRKPGIPTN